jgi:hypothetical protein
MNMGSPDTIQYQKALMRLFDGIFHEDVPQLADWGPFKRTPEVISPQFDYAVGPFAERKLVFDDEYDELMDENERLFNLLLDTHNHNTQELYFTKPLKFREVKLHNQNARALILVKIQRKISPDRILGSMLNTSLLGKVGIMVAWDDDKFDAVKDQLDYLGYLYRKKVFGYKPRNLLVFQRNQLLEILNYCG